MKYYLSLLPLLLFFVCSGQIYSSNKRISSSNKRNSFELTGKLLGRDTGYIILLYPDTSGTYVHDTSYLENGNFKFQGIVKEPSFAHLIGSKKNGNYSNFYLEAGSQSIVLEENHFDKAQMKGSKTQGSYDSLQKEINKISSEMNVLEHQKVKLDSAFKNQKKGYVKVEEQKLDELNDEINKLYHETINVRLNFIKSHSGSYVSVTELSGLLIVNRYPVNLIRPLYEALTKEIKNSRAGLYCLKEIEARSRLTAGNYLSNFRMVNGKNKRIYLNDFKNKYVLLDFWASWCIPCREQIPYLKQIYNKYHTHGFEIIGVSLDQSKAKWEKAIQADSTGNWIQVLKSEEMEPIFRPIQVIPQQILLDKTGKIIWSSLDNNTNTWTQVLESQLKLTSVQ